MLNPTRIRSIFFLLVCLLSFQAKAEQAANCPPPTEPQFSQEAIQEGMKNARDRGFLWRIEKDGHTSYLYGTVHAGKQEWLYPGPTLAQAMRETDTVALELDMFDPATMARIKELAASRKGNPLPAKLQERLRQQAAAACLPYEAIAGMSPELQVVTLMVMVAKKEGLDPAYAVDTMLAGFGHNSRRKVVSLETPDLQMQTLHMESTRDTLTFVDASLKTLESGHAAITLNRLVKAWAESDYGLMESYPSWCECMDTPIERKAMQRLLDTRNPALAKGIDKLHQGGGKVFAAVGSMHLFGPRGLPNLMKQKGYKVEQITFPRP